MLELPEDLTVNLDELRKRSLFVAFPAYGNKIHVPFHQSMVALFKLMANYDLKYQELPLTNDALITRARNNLTHEFLQSDFTNFMFIDTDIQFDPMHVLHMFALQDNASEFDVIGAAYPRKSISWRLIEQAVKLGKKPEELHKYVGDFVFNPTGRGQMMEILQPSMIAELGTGFMMIKRETLTVLRDAHPEWCYKADHGSWAEFDKSNDFRTAFWRAPIDPKTRRLMSEDYQFCQDVRDAGMKVWLCPWIPLTHYGDFGYGGSMTESLIFLSEIQHAQQRSNAQVEGREAPQRGQEGTQGDEAKSGDRDHA